jgi:septum formation protein
MSMVRAAHIILASASPRRTSILNEQLGLNVRAIPSGFAENLDKGSLSPISYVQETARQKALEVYGRCEKPFKAQHERPPSLVIGADTVVVLDGEVLEKPGSLADARRMLRKLSDAGTHSVITGVSMLYGGTELGGTPHEKTFAEITTVTFKQMSDSEIDAYIATGEPMDKAGGYGIQGLGGCFVTGITGDYFNVVGARTASPRPHRRPHRTFA